MSHPANQWQGWAASLAKPSWPVREERLLWKMGGLQGLEPARVQDPKSSEVDEKEQKMTDQS